MSIEYINSNDLPEHLKRQSCDFAGKWTPVTEALPELSGQYLITEEFAYMRMVAINTYLNEYVAGCFEKKSQYSGAGFYEFTCPGHYEKNEFVVAWAELPDAYEGDLDELFE